MDMCRKKEKEERRRRGLGLLPQETQLVSAKAFAPWLSGLSKKFSSIQGRTALAAFGVLSGVALGSYFLPAMDLGADLYTGGGFGARSSERSSYDPMGNPQRGSSLLLLNEANRNHQRKAAPNQEQTATSTKDNPSDAKGEGGKESTTEPGQGTVEDQDGEGHGKPARSGGLQEGDGGISDPALLAKRFHENQPRGLSSGLGSFGSISLSGLPGPNGLGALRTEPVESKAALAASMPRRDATSISRRRTWLGLPSRMARGRALAQSSSPGSRFGQGGTHYPGSPSRTGFSLATPAAAESHSGAGIQAGPIGLGEGSSGGVGSVGSLGAMGGGGSSFFQSGTGISRTRLPQSAMDELEDADTLSDEAQGLEGDSDASHGGSLPFDMGDPRSQGGNPLLADGFPYDDLDRPKKKAYRGPLGPDGRAYEDFEDENAEELQPPAEPPAQDTTPWRKLTDRAQKLILAASALILAAALASKLPLVGYAVATALAGAAAALAGAVTVIGMILLVKHGQMLQGGMFALTGGLLTWQAIQAVKGYYDKHKLDRFARGEAKKITNHLRQTGRIDKTEKIAYRIQDGKIQFLRSGDKSPISPWLTREEAAHLIPKEPAVAPNLAREGPVSPAPASQPRLEAKIEPETVEIKPPEGKGEITERQTAYLDPKTGERVPLPQDDQTPVLLSSRSVSPGDAGGTGLRAPQPTPAGPSAAELTIAQKGVVQVEVEKLKGVLDAPDLSVYIDPKSRDQLLTTWEQAVKLHVDKAGTVDFPKAVNFFQDKLMQGREYGTGITRTAEHFGEITAGTYNLGRWAGPPAALGASFSWNTFSITKGKLLGIYNYIKGQGPLPSGNWGSMMNHSLVTEGAAAGWASTLPNPNRINLVDGISNTLNLHEVMPAVKANGVVDILKHGWKRYFGGG